MLGPNSVYVFSAFHHRLKEEHSQRTAAQSQVSALTAQLTSLQPQAADTVALRNDIARLEATLAAANASNADLRARLETAETKLDAEQAAKVGVTHDLCVSFIIWVKMVSKAIGYLSLHMLLQLGMSPALSLFVYSYISRSQCAWMQAIKVECYVYVVMLCRLTCYHVTTQHRPMQSPCQTRPLNWLQHCQRWKHS